MRKHLFLSIMVLGFIGLVSAASVGAVPSSIDFGQVEPGETIEQSIYITVRSASSGENFTINPNANEIGSSSLFSGRYDNHDEISEQSSEDWWDFERATVGPNIRVEPDNIDISNPPTLNGVVSGTLQIPENAEPGLHYGHVNLNPDISAEGDGAGARFISPTRVQYSFYVAGEPQRDIVVQDVRAFRLGESRAAVEVLLSNQGTVTASTEDFEIDVLGSGRSQEETLEVDGATLEPGESQWVDASWFEGSGIEEGTYQIDGEVDYFTGSAYASGSFSLPEFNVVEVRPENSPGSNPNQQQSGLPLWLVFMVLAILTVLMWSFDIEPFWILAIIGGLAVASFILLSGVSNYLLVVLLMAVGIVVYGVM